MTGSFVETSTTISKKLPLPTKGLKFDPLTSEVGGECVSTAPL